MADAKHKEPHLVVNLGKESKLFPRLCLVRSFVETSDSRHIYAKWTWMEYFGQNINPVCKYELDPVRQRQ